MVDPSSAWDTWLKVVWTFLRLSLFSLGGGNTLLAEYHHLSVERFGWITSSQFADISVSYTHLTLPTICSV